MSDLWRLPVEKAHTERTKKKAPHCERNEEPSKWSHLGLNQGLPDYESGALTN